MRHRRSRVEGEVMTSSRLPGFYRLTIAERRELVAVGDEVGRLPVEVADRMSENVVGCHGLPLSVALNFRVNGTDHLVPMAIEEPSVVAAASRAALLVRGGGGFTGEADPAIMTAQVQLDCVPDPDGAAGRLAACEREILALGDRSIPSMVARGGGCRAIEARVIDDMVVVHIYVDVGNAMGANLCDTVAEAAAPAIAACVGGRLGLRILSNLPLRRLVRVSARVPLEVMPCAEGVVRATRFAAVDPMRAVTHNKGIMNGIDAVALALGQDWRAIEAGAHAFAALAGAYRPLSSWRIDAGALVGRLELPLAVGTVGGAIGVHPGARAALAMVGVDGAGQLAIVMAAAGLASNLAALDALAGDGIQRGHMRLHRRRLEEESHAAGL
jgi:hydroxymethylglutaryl-CoA reductase